MRALPFAIVLAGCQSVAGLGDPAVLAEAETGADTGAVDVALDVPDDVAETTPEAPSTSLFLYRAGTGDVSFVDLATDGRVTPVGVAHLAPNLTHFAALEGKKLLSYDAATGARTVSTVDPRLGTFSTITSDTGPGFTAFAGHDKGRLLVSYRAKEGVLRLDRVVGTSIGKIGELAGGGPYADYDRLISTREGPFLLYDSKGGRSFIGTWKSGSEPQGALRSDIAAGWSPIATIFSTHIFFFRYESPQPGLSALTQLSEKGSDLDLAYWNDGLNDVPSIGVDWSHIVGTPKTLLFYRTSDGKVLTATIASDDFVIRFLELTPTPAPVIGAGWTHLVALE